MSDMQGRLRPRQGIKVRTSNKYLFDPNLVQDYVKDGTLTIQKNGSTVATFTANQEGDSTANLIIPTTPADIGALPDSTTIADLATTAQLAAVNSGATATKIGQITTNQNAIGTLSNLTTAAKTDLVSAVNEVDGIASTALQPNDNISSLTNDSGYITGITSGDVTTALGYTPADSASLATVATTGDYDDLTNKPTIPAAQVNSDWNANSGVAEILNKPTLGTMAAESASDYTKTSGLATVATTGDYDDLLDKPTIPTVNNATLTITQGGVSKGTFTANASSDVTIALAAGGTWGSITGTLSDQTDLANALSAKYDASNPNGYTSNVGTVTSVNNALPDANGNVTVSVGGVAWGAIGGTLSDQTDLQNALNAKANSATTLAGYGITDGANTSLSNLSSDGQLIIDSQNGTISNCILEIPQNLKFEFNNGTVTLKSGSVITKTGSTYATITTSADITWSSSTQTNATLYLIATNSGNAQGLYNAERVEKMGSGSSLPADGSTYLAFYNTTDKTIYNWSNNAWSAGVWAYPLGVVETDGSGNITGFKKDSNGNDMIFNGAGFIGHHAFVYPNVKGLIPNELNDDNSLESILKKQGSLNIINMTSNTGMKNIALTTGQAQVYRDYFEVEKYSDITVIGAYRLYYVKSTNTMYETLGNWQLSKKSCVRLVSFELDANNIVTDFTIRQPVRTATVEMLNKKQDTLTFDTAPTSASTNPVTSGGVYTALNGKQDTLVSGTNIKTINSTTVLGTGNFTLANQSLSNLDSTGQMTVDSLNGTISNCILEIPQNIKCSIASNVVTLSSGSILTNTGSAYATTTLSANQTYTISNSLADGNYLLCSNGAAIQAPMALSSVGSGNTTPADGSTYTYFFNTTDKKIYAWSGSAWLDSGYCYPFAEVTVASGVASFTKDSNGNDMIFNGAGFIGHHAFVYPNVKGLLADRLDSENNLKSKSNLSASLQIVELESGTNLPLCANSAFNLYKRQKYIEVENMAEADSIGVAAFYYIKNENIVMSWAGVGNKYYGFLKILSCSYVGGVVTDFTIRQPIRTATVEMLDNYATTSDITNMQTTTNLVTSVSSASTDSQYPSAKLLYDTASAKADDSAVVKLSGDQTIADIKTFTSSPVVPTPATSDNSTKAATTAFVNDWISANTATAHVVVDSWRSGANFYRVYSDGWIEQGGWKSGFSAANTFEDVALHKEFADTYYNVQISGGGSSTTIGNYKTGNSSTNTTTAFKLLASSTGAACWWYACGMGA